VSIESAPPTQLLNDPVENFWGSDNFNWVAPQIIAPTVENAVLRRLGSPPGDLKKPLETLYRAMTLFVQAKITGNDDSD